jgi:hypothetical protein
MVLFKQSLPHLMLTHAQGKHPSHRLAAPNNRPNSRYLRTATGTFAMAYHIYICSFYNKYTVNLGGSSSSLQMLATRKTPTEKIWTAHYLSFYT